MPVSIVGQLAIFLLLKLEDEKRERRRKKWLPKNGTPVSSANKRPPSDEKIFVHSYSQS